MSDMDDLDYYFANLRKEARKASKNHFPGQRRVERREKRSRDQKYRRAWDE